MPCQFASAQNGGPDRRAGRRCAVGARRSRSAPRQRAL